MKELIEKISKFLKENNLSVESIEQYQSLPVVEIAISWGDWRHDHGRLKYLMGEKFEKENIYFGGEVTEENGSDCYSAVHRFGFIMSNL